MYNQWVNFFYNVLYCQSICCSIQDGCVYTKWSFSTSSSPHVISSSLWLHRFIFYQLYHLPSIIYHILHEFQVTANYPLGTTAWQCVGKKGKHSRNRQGQSLMVLLANVQPTLKNMTLKINLLIFMCHSTCVETKGHLHGANSLLTPFQGFQRLKVPRFVPHAPLLTELSF